MEKSKIKELLRETFTQPILEKEEKDSNSEKEKSKGTEKDYGEVTRKLDGTMLKASQVMAAAGLGNPKNATDRSLFSKKVRREKNEEGGVYQFNDEELAKIVKIINNPAAYLNVKA
jgi:hypothetical protein